MSTTTNSKSSQLRLLILTPGPGVQSESLGSSSVPDVLDRLTGSRPSQVITSFAGYTSHPSLHLKTKYYEADVSIWCDELPSLAFSSRKTNSSDEVQPLGLTGGAIPSNQVSQVDSGGGRTRTHSDQGNAATIDSIPTLNDWKDQMTSSSASEVREVIGAIALVLPITKDVVAATTQTNANKFIDKEWIPYIDTVSSLRDTIEDETGRDVASLVILHDSTTNNSTLSGPLTKPATNKSRSKSKRGTSALLLQNLEDECLSTHGIMGWEFIYFEPDGSSLSPMTTTTTATATATSNVSEQKPSDKDDKGRPEEEEEEKEERNEFGEKVGFPRVLEVLSGVDWCATISSDDQMGDDYDFDFDADDDDDDHNQTDEFKPFNVSAMRTKVSPPLRFGPGVGALPGEHEFQQEMMGLKMAMLDIENERESENEIENQDPSHRQRQQQQQQQQQEKDEKPFLDGNDIGNLDFLEPEQGRGATQRDKVGSDKHDDAWASLDADAAGDEIQVDQMQSLMERVIAIREAGSEMSKSEREKFAKREIGKIMRELG